MPRQIETANGLLVLPDLNEPGVCPDYDEDCDGIEDYARCWLGGDDRLFWPCPYLD